MLCSFLLCPSLSLSPSLPPPRCLTWVMACESSIKQILHTLIVPKVSSGCSRANALPLHLPSQTGPELAPELLPHPQALRPNKPLQCCEILICNALADSCSRRVYLIFFANQIFGLGPGSRVAQLALTMMYDSLATLCSSSAMCVPCLRGAGDLKGAARSL